ncbi:MAG: RNA polymerase sigma factor [Candidatus Scalinduaceae bacterium]
MSFSGSQGEQNPYLTDPDVLLMLEFQEGHKASFEKLMDKYYKRVMNLIYRFVGNKEVAEDLTQDVFVKVYKNARLYKPKAKFQTWLYQIAKNTCLNELRKKRSVVSFEETFEVKGNPVKHELTDADNQNPYQTIDQKETVAAVKDAIASLPENQRMAVNLRRYEQLSYDDIAQTMNCSIAAVKSLLSRAKLNLKEKLKDLIQFD